MKPAKSWICYFSPTGTSRRVAEAVGRGLNCTQTVVCDATHDAVCVAAERGDAAVFAVPVYGGHAAPLALRRLDAVRGDGTPAVVVVLYGNRAYEHAACELADVVAARGFVPVAAAAVVGEAVLVSAVVRDDAALQARMLVVVAGVQQLLDRHERHRAGPAVAAVLHGGGWPRAHAGAGVAGGGLGLGGAGGQQQGGEGGDGGGGGGGGGEGSAHGVTPCVQFGCGSDQVPQTRSAA